MFRTQLFDLLDQVRRRPTLSRRSFRDEQFKPTSLYYNIICPRHILTIAGPNRLHGYNIIV